jgi:hypothetical protein
MNGPAAGEIEGGHRPPANSEERSPVATRVSVPGGVLRHRRDHTGITPVLPSGVVPRWFLGPSPIINPD